MKLSIIIPVYNEEKTIRHVINKVSEIDYNIDTEIIIINDGSSDKTFNELNKFKKKFKKLKIISYKKNKGKGYAIRLGIAKSKGNIIVIQDADLEYSPNQIPYLISPLMMKQKKVVYGSRFMGEYRNMKFFQLLGNKILTFLTNLLFGSNLTDMETCYKCIHKDILNKIDLFSDGFEIEAEISAKILKSGFEIYELPIDYSARTKKEGKKINWKDAIKNIVILLKVKFSIFDG